MARRKYDPEARRTRTLLQYGMTPELYDQLLRYQGGMCALCSKPLAGTAVHVDHEHVPGFSKLPPEEKRKHVRGLLHFGCNRYHVAKNTALTAAWVADYLRAPPGWRLFVDRK